MYREVEKYGIAADSYVTLKEVEINGCISVPEHCTEDEVLDKFSNFFGGRSGSYEGELIEARGNILKELEQRARVMG